MRDTPLGTTGLTTSVQGLGCMRMSESANRATDAEAAAVIGRALDLGVTMLDTSDMYGDGHNEGLVGRAIRDRRDEVVVCTKFGAVRGPGDTWSIRGDAGYVPGACDASLERLGVDVIDLWYLSRRDTTVPIEESVGAMAEQVRAGKVRHLGLSEISGPELAAAHGVHPIAAVQTEWSITCRRIEAMVPVCVELGVGVVPYSPLGRGALGGGTGAVRRRLDGTGGGSGSGADPDRAAVVEALVAVADRHGATPGQVALAWVQRRADVWGIPVVPIPGTRQVPHLEENVAALDVALDADDVARLDAVSTAPART